MQRNEQEHYLNEHLVELEDVNKSLAKLTVRKEELTREIISALDHHHEGQKSYEYDIWKIEVKTPCVYSLNKQAYQEGNINLPEEFNPIKQHIAYTIDKRLCDKYINEAPKKVRDVLAKLIDKKPGKASVVLKERV